jgi:heat shock protein HslJ
MMKYIFGIAAALLLFASCDAIKPGNEVVKLEERKWQLVQINHKPVAADKIAYLELDDSKVKGKAFCNGFGGEYERAAANQLTFSGLISTKMYCEGVMDLENQMVTNLQEVKRFEIRNGMLYLYNSDELLLVFKK